MSAGSCPPCRAGADLFQTQADPPSAPPELAGLTERECEILDLLAAGAGNDAIARTLSVSNKTVRNTVSGIYAKLHANASCASSTSEATWVSANSGSGAGWRPTASVVTEVHRAWPRRVRGR